MMSLSARWSIGDEGALHLLEPPELCFRLHPLHFQTFHDQLCCSWKIRKEVQLRGSTAQLVLAERLKAVV